ncbi:MAG: TonB-dependent receptor plug domain-containing protein [Gammaproteobacteria bacterium]
MLNATRSVVPCAGLTALALLATGATTLLNSQPAAAAADNLTEIIVTVRQRAESIQDVPGSVSAFSSAQIESLGIHRAEDFVGQTPGVSMVNSAEVADTQVNIRGINGARDAETNYALIIDGVLMTNPAALNREYLNLQQIEILKGPQGALYGRNAAAGAIIINTKKPGDTWGGDVKASYAQDSTYSLSGLVGGPVSDTLSVSIRG